MKEVTIQVQDKEYQFFMKLVKNLPFVKSVRPANPAGKKVLSELQASIEELKLIKSGKKKGISARSLLKEL